MPFGCDCMLRNRIKATASCWLTLSPFLRSNFHCQLRTMAKMQSLFIVAVMLTLVNVAMSVTCPYPFIAVGSGCYTVTLETGITWEQALDNCESNLNASLAEIESAQEQADVETFLLEIDPNFTNLFWIGLTDQLIEGEFEWITSGHNVSYTNWMPGAPDDYPNNDCVYIDYAARQWNDCPCNAAENVRRGLCEGFPF